MKSRETLLGLLVLALVGGGVWWARGRGLAGTPPPPAPAAKGSAPDAPPVIPMPDVTLADESVDLGGVRLLVSVAPRPILAFAKNRFRLRADSNGSPVPIEGGRLAFEMRMPMGDHRYSLVDAADGWMEAEVVLPLCGSGERRWFATFEGTVGGQPRTARFQLDLAPPPSPAAP